MSSAASGYGTPPRQTQTTGHVEAVSRAARILKAFEPDSPAMSIRQISDRTGIPKSTCHTMVSTLVAEGLLEPRDGGGYQLGEALAHLGGMVLERSGLVERATPHMEMLSTVTGGEVHLAHSVDLHLIYLARVRRNRRVNMPNRFGRPIPLHRTGCGWATLLALEPEQRDSALLDVPAAKRKVILEEINRGLAREYIVHNDFAVGVCSIATPVPIGHGHIASVSVAQLRPLMNDRNIAQTGQLILKAKRALQATLG